MWCLKIMYFLNCSLLLVKLTFFCANFPHFSVRKYLSLFVKFCIFLVENLSLFTGRKFVTFAQDFPHFASRKFITVYQTLLHFTDRKFFDFFLAENFLSFFLIENSQNLFTILNFNMLWTRSQ
jgi:hypothetical protein